MRPQTKETKMAAHDALQSQFEAFKAANDARLAAIETGRADVLLEDKVERIDRALAETKAAIERLALKELRPPLGQTDAVGEHKSAWSAYMRRGDETALARLETKALTAAANDAGFTAPAELDRLIEIRLRQVSPMRQIATVRVTGAGVFKKPVSTTQAGGGWVSETGDRAQTATPSLVSMDFPVAELYANLAATQTLLDDSYLDIESWIADEVEQAFAAQERAAFVTGDGTNKPKGFLAYTPIADASYTWGKIGYVATGAAGAFPAGGAAVDKLLDLAYAPRAEFRQNARFTMNRKTVSAIRKLKDADGRYIWQPESQSAGSTILGYPVTEIEDMPDVGADAFAIAFGDFQRFYLIVDRAGVNVLRDPYSSKPYVLFYVTKRLAGGVQNFDAVKLMKFGAS